MTVALVLVDHWWSRTGIRRSGMDPPGRLLAAAVATLPDHRREWGMAMQAELAEVQGRSARWQFALSGARAVLRLPPLGGWPALALATGVVAGIAALPLTYALWLHEALRLYAINGGLLWFGDGAPEGENLSAALFWALRFAPLLGLPFAVIGAAIGAGAARPPAAQAQHAATTVKP